MAVTNLNHLTGRDRVRQLSSRYRSRHKVSLPDGRRHTLASGSTYDPGGSEPVIRLL